MIEFIWGYLYRPPSRIWQYFSTIVGLIFRHPIVGVTVIPITSQGQVVLILRRDNQRWAFPGGFIDWGEDLRTTATREILEETGLRIVEFGRLVGVYSSPDRDPRLHSISITVSAEVEGQFTIIDRGEIMDVKTFELSAVPRGLMSHDHLQQFEDYLANHTTFF